MEHVRNALAVVALTELVWKLIGRKIARAWARQ